MLKAITAIPLLCALSATAAQFEVNRCVAPDKFVYWTPMPCSPEHTHNGTATFNEDQRSTSYENIVRMAECRWQTMMQNQLTDPLPRNAKPEMAYPSKANLSKCT